MMSDASAILKEVFGHERFRGGQEQAVNAALAGRDVEVVLPTGGGKSLCYQLPAVIRQRRGEGPTVVISPLIALMEDQLAALREKGVAAEAVHSGMRWSDQREALGRGADAAVILCSPERLAVARFRSWLQRIGVAAAAVDEAHCVSEWGHDFRPDYRKLAVLKTELGLPVTAVTATATPRVRSDIRQTLQLRDPVQVLGGFARPNLHFTVEHVPAERGRTARVAALLDAHGLGHRRSRGRAVVYASSRKRVKALRDALVRRGFHASWYHAGRTDGARAQAQAAFAAGRATVLVATTAFGMGIDVPDIRLVVHAQAPTTLEAWYQQAGRAGRDGEPAHAVLLWSRADAILRRRLVGDSPPPGAEAGWSALQAMAEGRACRQQAIARYFTGSDGAACGICDACTEPERVHEALTALDERTRARRTATREKRRRDAEVTLDEAQRGAVLRFVDALKRPVGRTMVAAGLRGSRAKRAKRVQGNPEFGVLRGVPESAILRAVDDLLASGQLTPKGKKYPTVWIAGKRVRPARSKTATPKVTGLARALRNLRSREARRRRWKPYQVFTNATLAAIVETRPTTRDALAAVPGIGPKKLERFAGAILAAVADNP